MMDDEDLFPPERERELSAMPASTVDGESQEEPFENDRKQTILDEQFPTLKGKDARIQTLYKKIAPAHPRPSSRDPNQCAMGDQVTQRWVIHPAGMTSLEGGTPTCPPHSVLRSTTAERTTSRL